jgi:HK97 family phage major capsid protein
MYDINELRERVATLTDEVRELSELDDITEDQDARLDAALDELDEARTAVDKAEARAARIAKINEQRTGEHAGVPPVAPQIMRRVETKDLDVRSLDRSEARDAAMKLMETEARDLSEKQLVDLERKISRRSRDTDGDHIARRLLLTERDVYRSAFAKAMTSPNPAWTSEEARAINEVRGQSLTDNAGGYGVPVFIDPTIILTSGAADAPILSIARVETITNDEWKGVSSVAAAWSYDAEGVEVSDDAVTLAQPTVTTHMGRGFIPFTIEIGMDYPGFAMEMARVIEQGYLDLVAATSMTGTGSAQPFGIFTAIDATAGSEVAVTTDGALGPEDALKVWADLPERFRTRATWVGNTSVFNEIRNNGTSDGLFTVDLSQGGISRLLGRPVVETDYAPAFTGTTGAANLLVVGDFQHFVVAQRAGMSIEYVPHLFSTTTNLPNGQRGYFAYARHGMDSVADNAFRLLQNT